MLHYVTPQSNKSYGESWSEIWRGYTEANELIAKVIATKAMQQNPNASVWIHNYHLLCLPSYIRALRPRAKIGLFIHTPFPSSDIFRVLPTRASLLSSMMCVDLIGFHTFDYARH